MSISGHFIYKNLAISQHADVSIYFNSLIEKVRPSRILEIGTSHGGLTLMLRDILDSNNLYDTNLTTYDIHDPVFLKDISNKLGSNIAIKVEDLFCNNYKNFQNNDIKDGIKNYIQQRGITIVLCDGGSKSVEFNLFSELLKEKDIIMAHDYAPDQEYFEKYIRDKIWNWHEIKDSDISESCKKYNLHPYMRDEFLKVVWACFQRL